MTTQTTDGVVLRVTEYRESARIIPCYTRDLGKISALARHATKSRKRFGTQLNTFQLLQFRLNKKAHRNLAHLEAVRPLASLSGIYQDWRRIAAACFIADLTNEMTREGSVNPRIFEAVQAALLEINRPGDWWVAVARFAYQLLEAAGYRPAIRACVHCREPWLDQSPVYWVHAAGGAHCRNCLPGGAPFEILQPPLRQTLVALADGQGEGVDDGEHVKECAGLLYAFIRYQLGRPVRAWEFLEKVGLAS